MIPHKPLRPVLLCILDGFGHREAAPDNAVTQADMPVWRKIWAERPHALLAASGADVGLPEGQIGNSEVGHMTIGAGRVVLQDLPKIDRAIETGELAAKKELADFTAALKQSGGTCHVLGLASDGGVHAHLDHLIALARLVADKGVPVFVHAFLDGRDVPPDSAVGHIAALEKELEQIGGARLASLCGRYYAMDRDNRWDRVEKAYDLLVSGEGTKAPDAVDAIESSYVDGVTDEFILPLALTGYEGMKDGDGVLFANFRADRARQIFRALLDPAFAGFERKKTVSFAAALGMGDYAEDLRRWAGALFPPKTIENGLGEIVARAGLRQLRIAETEKYAHVTFFFNGGREAPFEGEERIMVPSPKIATYDLQPEMSAFGVADKVVKAIESGGFDLIVLNFANPDMVGHTGILPAAVKALEAVDLYLGRILAALEKAGGAALITADHGNCECMADPENNGPHTAHTLSFVPLVYFGTDEGVRLRGGRLADVAPTILDLMGLDRPDAMEGESLLVKA